MLGAFVMPLWKGKELCMAEMIMSLVRGMAPEKSAVEAVRSISPAELVGILEEVLRSEEEI